ncbi:hypothetical protein [Hugenholtzia roseola]|uniref:hypothetical protein n=1 Tax=Hugenholtzia roseola TaxID=1002 RepID=UPI00040CB374|nr:hypothetical protein [Hugenholtzia roseola]
MLAFLKRIFGFGTKVRNVTELTAEERRKLIHQWVVSTAIPAYKRRTQFGYSLLRLRQHQNCPRCKAKTNLHYAVFVCATSNSETAQHILAPAGYFCEACPTVIIDEKVLKKGMTGGRLKNILGIALETETLIFRGWNGHKTLPLFDQNNQPIDLKVSDEAIAPLRNKNPRESRNDNRNDSRNDSRNDNRNESRQENRNESRNESRNGNERQGSEEEGFKKKKTRRRVARSRKPKTPIEPSLRNEVKNEVPAVKVKEKIKRLEQKASPLKTEQFVEDPKRQLQKPETKGDNSKIDDPNRRKRQNVVALPEQEGSGSQMPPQESLPPLHSENKRKPEKRFDRKRYNNRKKRAPIRSNPSSDKKS